MKAKALSSQPSAVGRQLSAVRAESRELKAQELWK
jgi:hypothetical protein